MAKLTGQMRSLNAERPQPKGAAMPTSLVLDDPAFEVADLADKLSEQTDKRTNG
jgi:hypothetical protein